MSDAAINRVWNGGLESVGLLQAIWMSCHISNGSARFQSGFDKDCRRRVVIRQDKSLCTGYTGCSCPDSGVSTLLSHGEWGKTVLTRLVGRAKSVRFFCASTCPIPMLSIPAVARSLHAVRLLACDFCTVARPLYLRLNNDKCSVKRFAGGSCGHLALMRAVLRLNMAGDDKGMVESHICTRSRSGNSASCPAPGNDRAYTEHLARYPTAPSPGGTH